MTDDTNTPNSRDELNDWLRDPQRRSTGEARIPIDGGEREIRPAHVDMNDIMRARRRGRFNREGQD
jgi:hypothetical protein